MSFACEQRKRQTSSRYSGWYYSILKSCLLFGRKGYSQIQRLLHVSEFSLFENHVLVLCAVWLQWRKLLPDGATHKVCMHDALETHVWSWGSWFIRGWGLRPDEHSFGACIFSVLMVYVLVSGMHHICFMCVYIYVYVMYIHTYIYIYIYIYEGFISE